MQMRYIAMTRLVQQAARKTFPAKCRLFLSNCTQWACWGSNYATVHLPCHWFDMAHPLSKMLLSSAHCHIVLVPEVVDRRAPSDATFELHSVDKSRSPAYPSNHILTLWKWAQDLPQMSPTNLCQCQY